MSSNQQSGYEFTAQDLSLIREMLERVQAAKGVTLSATTGEARGFAASRIGVDDAGLGAHGDLVHIQSFRDSAGGVFFTVLSVPDSEQVGPDGAYRSLQTAIVHAHVFLDTVVGALIARRGSHALPSSQGAVRLADAQLLKSFAMSLGQQCKLEGFADIREVAKGVTSIGIGLLHGRESTILGTLVVVSDGHKVSCSARDFANRPMPGPSFYSDVPAALSATRSYFEKLAQLTAKHVRPSFLKRLFG